MTVQLKQARKDKLHGKRELAFVDEALHNLGRFVDYKVAEMRL